MTITYRPATREQTSLFIGLAGPSSSGKTYSALRLATGLAQGRPIYMIDTESGRGLHYADTFKYEYGALSAPFTPQAYLEAIQSAVAAGAGVVVVDSMSHEHDGPGGILEMHEAELDARAGSDFKKRERMNFSCWIKPKGEHNKFVNAILQLGTNVHVIFCFRAKQKLQLDKRGNSYEIPKAWMPICAADFQYEMTALLMLPPNSGGVPDLSLEATKLQEQHRSIIPTGAQIGEQTGAAFAAWANGGAQPAQQTAPQQPAEPATAPSDAAGPDDPAEVERIAYEVATLGMGQLEQHWKLIGSKGQNLLKDKLPDLKRIAAEADAEMADTQADVPFDSETAEAAA